jgi:hemin uptake protein HemP
MDNGMSNSVNTIDHDAPQDVETTQEEPLQLSSRDLFRNGKTVRIEHQSEFYWLRLTRANKLILTK